MKHFHRTRRLLLMLTASCLIGGLSSACGDSSTRPSPLEGDYIATVFRVTPNGGSETDVLALGGSLSISIRADNSTTGTLFLPASVAGTSFTASMAGTAVQSGAAIHFEQSVDTFVRDLAFTLSGTSLQVTNQVAGSATFTITLSRQ